MSKYASIPLFATLHNDRDLRAISLELAAFITVIAIVIILLVVIELPPKARPFKNHLNLKAIPQIKDVGLQHKLFSDAYDELVYLIIKLRRWYEAEKSLVDFVRDEAHKKALLGDLEELRRRAAIDLTVEKQKETGWQSPRLIENREHFISKVYEHERGRLLSWEPPIEREERFDFEQLKGFCLLTYKSGAITKIRLQLQEAGLFSIGWKEAGSISEEVELIEKEIGVDGSTAVIIKLQEARRSGTIYIINHTRKAIERVPV